MQGTVPAAGWRGRPCTAWMDSINMWTGLPVEESIEMTEINGESTSMVWPTVGSRTAEEQNRVSQVFFRTTALYQFCCCCFVFLKQSIFSDFAC